ncbi:2-oxoacid ferredoxin oxidoreductase [Candidatus Microgenomates bacterium]|jgi:2-oxoglutarate ferredoxin oxidoreductase subunit beta|nr:MAG: 2-oxoacid ferredoxin oxidoreductase [Candidatus Microgenomates bacterium]
MNTDLSTPNLPTWCPGCGGYSFLTAVKKAIIKNNLAPKDVVITYDIGCSANMVNFINLCGFATLHGRSIPVAVGVKTANPKLTVIAQGGDGGIVSEGGNHLVHASQRNDDITVLVNNNYVFALTTGQASSATPKGLKTRTTLQGNPFEPLSAIDLAVVSGGSFLARTPVSDLNKTTEIIAKAIEHKGFSLVEIIQPCVIWTKELLKPSGQWVKEPFTKRESFLGRHDLWGILYNK